MLNFNPQQFELFSSLFRGRTDTWARHWEKDGRSGYSPAYEFDWDEFLAHKNRGGSLKDFQNKRLIPLTPDVIKKHLIGQHAVGIYPILPDSTTYFLAADFDGESWKDDAKSFIAAAESAGLAASLERSRSGEGGHVWIFFSDPYPCWKSRRIGLELIRKTFCISEFEKEISFDRLFPSQDCLSQAGFGNLIALPLQGKSIMQGNTVFIDLEKGDQSADQWKFLAQIKCHSASELEAVYNSFFCQEKQQRIAADAAKSGKLEIVVDNKIRLNRSQLAPKLIAFIKEELNFLNVEYITKKRLGKSIYKVRKYFKLIDEADGAISLTRGFLYQLIAFLKENGIIFLLRFEYPSLEEISFTSSIELALSQAVAVNSALAHDYGVIVSPAGSGKTIIGLELIARRKLPALILVHRQQLLSQWIERIQTFIGVPKAHIGRYDGVKKEFGEEITVGLLQSFSRKGDLSEIKNKFGTIIIDECHHVPAKTFREVVTQMNPRFIYGLTATPTRKHNDEKLIYAYIGDIVAKMENQSDLSLAKTAKNPIQVEEKTTKLAIPFRFKTDYFNLLAKVISFDTSRNQIIVEDILNQIKNGKKILVLSERKEHLEILGLYLKGKCEIIMISGDDSAAKRVIKLKQIESGHYQAILSTGQFFGEGIDIRGITCLILAFPFSFEGKLAQYIGRMRDVGEQKLIIDYRDQRIPFLEKQFKQRHHFYKKMAFKIISESNQGQMF